MGTATTSEVGTTTTTESDRGDGDGDGDEDGPDEDVDEVLNSTIVGNTETGVDVVRGEVAVATLPTNF